MVTRSLFHVTVAERSWRTHLTSGIVHVVLIAAAFLITFPVAKVLQSPLQQHITLIAPVLPHYRPHIEPPRLRSTAKLTLPVPAPPQAKPVIPPPVQKLVPQAVAKVTPPPVAPSPAPRIEAEAKVNLPPAPKPVVKTGSFQDAQLAKATPLQKQLQVGGFGDPRGVQSSETPKPAPVMMAKVGSFDNPAGAGLAGGGGRVLDGGVKASGFGNAGTPGPSQKAVASIRTGGFGEGAGGGSMAGHGAGVVRSTGFGETAAAPQRKEQAATVVAAFTPVEILFKPKPAYSSEARSLRLEGQVSLEVVFQASGSVRVVRVIRGLGHGLDEAAEQAAVQVRFKPATRSGAAVDTNATISITFELT